MGLKASVESKKPQVKRVEQQELAVDNFPCRVAQVIDLGRHHRESWDASSNRYVKDMEKAPANMVMLTYEFTTEFMKDENGNDVEDKPRWLSESFPIFALDSELATSTKRMRAFDPDFSRFKGDWEQVAAEPCAVTIVHKKNGKAKVGNVSKPMKGMVVPELKNPVKVFSLDAPDVEVFRSLPEWLQEKIKGNLDYDRSPLQAALEGGAVPNVKKEEKPAEKPVEKPQEPDVAQEDDDDAPW